MRQGKYDMEVSDGEELRFLFFDPSLSGYLLAFGAVSIAAGMIHDTLCSAVVAPINVPPHFSSAAVK
jgi:hypothetical protein